MLQGQCLYLAIAVVGLVQCKVHQIDTVCGLVTTQLQRYWLQSGGVEFEAKVLAAVVV